MGGDVRDCVQRTIHAIEAVEGKLPCGRSSKGKAGRAISLPLLQDMQRANESHGCVPLWYSFRS